MYNPYSFIPAHSKIAAWNKIYIFPALLVDYGNVSNTLKANATKKRHAVFFNIL